MISFFFFLLLLSHSFCIPPVYLTALCVFNDITHKKKKKNLCHTKFEVGDGSKIRFWHDWWCGDVALLEAFSNLFGITCVKVASVTTHLEFFGGSNQ
jgi:hypothetical protein